jgi:hypothetical protein
VKPNGYVLIEYIVSPNEPKLVIDLTTDLAEARPLEK